MRRRKVALTCASALVVAGLFACVGGPGALPGYDDNYDPLRGSFERPGPGRESPGPGREAPPGSFEGPTAPLDRAPGSGGGPTGGGGGGGGGGATALDCSGKYDCTLTVNGQPDTEDLTLAVRDGKCTADGQLVLEKDGRVTAAGQSIGTWSGGGTTFTFSIASPDGTATGSCTKRSGEDDPPPPEPGPAPPTDPVPAPEVDAG